MVPEIGGRTRLNNDLFETNFRISRNEKRGANIFLIANSNKSERFIHK